MQYDKDSQMSKYDKMLYDKLFDFFYHIYFFNMIKKKTYGSRADVRGDRRRVTDSKPASDLLPPWSLFSIFTKKKETAFIFTK